MAETAADVDARAGARRSIKPDKAGPARFVVWGLADCVPCGGWRNGISGVDTGGETPRELRVARVTAIVVAPPIEGLSHRHADGADDRDAEAATLIRGVLADEDSA